MYDSFRKYQSGLLAEFENLGKEFNFEVVDATPDVRTVFEHLRAGIARVLSGEPREPLFFVTSPAVAEAPEVPTKKVLEMPGPVKSGPSATDGTPQPLSKAAEGDPSR
jgi:hypothetical protein